MRDPQRIGRMLRKLEVLWWNSPDLRLGQLISNINPNYVDADPFNVEDDDWEAAIDKAIEALAQEARAKLFANWREGDDTYIQVPRS